MPSPAAIAYRGAHGLPLAGGFYPAGLVSGGAVLDDLIAAGAFAQSPALLSGNVTLDSAIGAATMSGVILPAWRSGMASQEWKELSGTAWSGGSGPSPQRAGIVGPPARINAWGGIAAVGTRIYIGGGGGHADYSGNECIYNELGIDSPGAPTMFIDASAPGDIYSADDYSGYYYDNRPKASHLYFSLHPNVSRNRIIRVVADVTYGPGDPVSTMDGFACNGSDWDARGTYPNFPESTHIAQPSCRDPRNDNIYKFGLNLWRWNSASNTWTQLHMMPSGSLQSFGAASAVDPVRNRVVLFGDDYAGAAGTRTGIQVYDMAGDSWSAANLTGPYATEICYTSAGFACYDTVLGQFVYKSGWGGPNVYLIDPVTWATSLMATTGGTPSLGVNGCFGLFTPMPALHGYAFAPTHTSNVWFLAI